MFKNDPTSFIDPVTISYRGRNRGKGKEHWAIMRLGWCLNKNQEWEWEPLGSQRDDDTIKRCRYDTVKEALEHYLKYIHFLLDLFEKLLYDVIVKIKE